MDEKLLEVLACPLCKGKLQYRRQEQKLFCNFDKLAFPVRNDIAILLVEQAYKLRE